MAINPNSAIWFSRTIAVSALATVLLALPASAQPNNPNPGVVPPFSTTAYGEWSAKWFQWAWEPPPASSPVLDTTGANCAVGQSGPVWFLAGTFFTSPPAPPPVTRFCTIPAGKNLFFPIANGFCGGDNFPNGFAGERACATSFAELSSGYSAEVDGKSVNALGGDLLHNFYRALSPPFDLVLGPDNIFGAPAGTYKPSAGDGVYLMLEPLSTGQHIIHFHADLGGGSQMDATYYLTVL